MEQYRTKLRMQCLMIAVASFAVALGCFLAPENTVMPDFWGDFLRGATVGFMSVLIVLLVRNIIALCDENRLRKYYIRDTDERTVQIWTSARAISTQIAMIGGLAASVIAGYFNVTVSITILACTAAHAFVALLAVLYYKIKL